MPIVGSRGLTSGHRGDYRRLAGTLQRLDDALVGIEGFVGQQSIGVDLRKEDVGAVEVVSLARRQMKGGRIAQGIDSGVDLGAQPPSAEPDRLFGLTVFFRAPALCWWARTMVLSSMAYSLSASAAKALNTFSQTPLFAQRA
jgi:hypothetical protein